MKRFVLCFSVFCAVIAAGKFLFHVTLDVRLTKKANICAGLLVNLT